MSDDWKGEHLIRGIKRLGRRAGSGKGSSGKARHARGETRECATPGCSSLLPALTPQGHRPIWCLYCIKQKHRETKP